MGPEPGDGVGARRAVSQRPARLPSAIAVENGLSEGELVEALTHLAFYAGWPNAMGALGKLKDLRESSAMS